VPTIRRATSPEDVISAEGEGTIIARREATGIDSAGLGGTIELELAVIGDVAGAALIVGKNAVLEPALERRAVLALRDGGDGKRGGGTRSKRGGCTGCHRSLDVGAVVGGDGVDDGSRGTGGGKDCGLGTRSGDNGLGARSGDNGLGARSGDNGLGARSGDNGLGARSGDSGLGARNPQLAIDDLGNTDTRGTFLRQLCSDSIIYGRENVQGAGGTAAEAKMLQGAAAAAKKLQNGWR
jgi:hypothetical protein